MMSKNSRILLLSVLILPACGGGGGGGAPSLVRTNITGNAAPPATPAPGAAAARADMLLPPASVATWPSIVQGADYTLDPTAAKAGTAQMTGMTVHAVDTQSGSTTITTDAQGQTLAIHQSVAGINYVLSTYGGTLAADFVAPGVPAVTIASPTLNTTSVYPNPGALATIILGYATPYSISLS